MEGSSKAKRSEPGFQSLESLSHRIRGYKILGSYCNKFGDNINSGNSVSWKRLKQMDDHFTSYFQSVAGNPTKIKGF